MTQKLETKNYEFYIDTTGKDRLMVMYLKEDKAISLSDLDIEMIGITKHKDIHTVAIVTQASIQKLKHNVSETLEIIGFHFNDQSTALAVLNFCLFWIEELKNQNREGRKNDSDIG